MPLSGLSKSNISVPKWELLHAGHDAVLHVAVVRLHPLDSLDVCFPDGVVQRGVGHAVGSRVFSKKVESGPETEPSETSKVNWSLSLFSDESIVARMAVAKLPTSCLPPSFFAAFRSARQSSSFRL